MQAKNFSRSPRVTINKYIHFTDYSTIFLFLVLIFTASTVKLFLDDGVFWHLSTGRFIAENKYIPSEDVFGITTSGTKWIPFEWGWDILTYFTWLAGGFELLSILRSVLTAAIFIPAFLFFRKSAISPLIYIPAALLLCFGLLNRLSIRPHLVTYCFISILLYLLLSHRLNKSKAIYFIPALFLIWSNLHPGVILGTGIMLCFTFSAAATNLFSKKFAKTPELNFSKQQLITLCYVTAASIAAIFVNPFNIETFIYAFNHTRMDNLELINEWISPFNGRVVQFYYVKIYIFFLCAGALVLIYSIRKRDIFLFLLYVVFAPYSVFAQRYAADYIVIIFIPLVFSAVSLCRDVFYTKKVKGKCGVKLQPLKKYSWLYLAAGLPEAAILVILIINLANNNIYRELNNKFRETGFGINENYYPVKLVDFMKDENIHETGSRPFNNLRIGGFFLWNFPGKKNFIDSRNLSDKVMQEYFDINLMKDGFEKKLDDTGFDYAFYSIPYMVENPRELEQNVISYFNRSDKWSLVYWDDKSLLYVKKEPKFMSIIEKHEYKYLTPYNYYFNSKVLLTDNKEKREEIMNELERKTSEDIGGIISNSMKYKLMSKQTNSAQSK